MGSATGAAAVAMPFLTRCICAKNLEAFKERGERDTERDSMILLFLLLLGGGGGGGGRAYVTAVTVTIASSSSRRPGRGEFVAAENILVHQDMRLI
jgi:hypothetical protein